MLEQYGHGGDLETARNLFGIKEPIDFSANINPLGPPPRLMDILRERLPDIIHYPDPAKRKLNGKLAWRLGVSPRQIVIGNGAAECMALVLLALKPARVGVVYPCFSEYEKLAVMFGAEVSACNGRSSRSYKPDLEDLLKLMRNTELVFIGQPNNPTGVLYTKNELRILAAEAEQENTYLVIDEAFIDFLPCMEKYTLLSELDRFPHVILIRSMTKFYAIPGLRLGYAVAGADLASRISAMQVTWSVNALALAAGEVCLDEENYEKRTLSLIKRERRKLSRFIRGKLGWTVYPGEANFLLVRIEGEMTSPALQQELGGRGILIRSCAMYPGLTDHHFRIAVRTQEENDMLLSALKELSDKNSKE
ncbi:threonine-phosphate decarboxylase CobD [Peribacillus sp. SCS-37]|uniref:threonine-phosphate decarboxylase CobD n=1 Tax=Paraperibacillus esterisolvens TaxID=3115296 RepID=UPI003906C3FB